MNGETRSTRQWVFNQLEEDILADKLPPETPLVEMKLAAELGVSRTPVREALRQLEQEGLVTFTPNRGMVVRGIRPEDVHDAYLIRSMLEGQAVRWAVERMTDEEMKGLLELIALMEYHAGRKDYAQLAPLDARFHEQFYSLCGSDMLRRTLQAMHKFVARARRLSLRSSQRALEVVSEHIAIGHAVEARDGQEAARLMEEHIRAAAGRVDQALSE